MDIDTLKKKNIELDTKVMEIEELKKTNTELQTNVSKLEKRSKQYCELVEQKRSRNSLLENQLNTKTIENQGVDRSLQSQ